MPNLKLRREQERKGKERRKHTDAPPGFRPLSFPGS